IKNNVSVSKSGKPVRSFSRSDFDKLAKAFLNTVDYEIETVSLKDGEVVTKKIEPVKALRGMIQRILLDFGVDKQEAARIMDTAYEIRNVDGIYELCSELIYKYLEAGKKFDFITKKDFVGSLTLKEVGDSVTEHKDIRTGDKIKVEKKAHKILDKKSKTPKWLKKRLK
ncbi:hypothetical protein, partial [Brevibacillus sp. MCWH]|uniref:hypothetical protein n=1 Tax=Brevibacillus sp. MCWH TaxID=2508871 RepID=UPI001492BD77